MLIIKHTHTLSVENIIRVLMIWVTHGWHPLFCSKCFPNLGINRTALSTDQMYKDHRSEQLLRNCTMS